MKTRLLSVVNSIIFLVLMGDVLATSVSKLKEDAREIHLKTSTLAVMAKHLSSEDDLLKRDFANIALLAMLRAYVAELDAAEMDPMSRKVSRWYRATRDYVERISTVQHLVESGEPFSMTVTREEKVLLVADALPMLISGPKATDSAISREVKAEYCRYHDCSWLKPESLVFNETKEQKSVRQEIWLFQQKQSPTFEINRQFQFVFKDFSQKEVKRAIANKAMLEVEEFLAEIKRATTKGYFINWNLMSQQVPIAGVDQTVFLNTGDLYLRLTLPLLAHLQLEDWQHLMEWLKWSLTDDDAILLIEQADSLLKAG